MTMLSSMFKESSRSSLFLNYFRNVPRFGLFEFCETHPQQIITENFSSLINDNIKKTIANSQILINEKLNLLSNSTEIHEFFSLN